MSQLSTRKKQRKALSESGTRATAMRLHWPKRSATVCAAREVYSSSVAVSAASSTSPHSTIASTRTAKTTCAARGDEEWGGRSGKDQGGAGRRGGEGERVTNRRGQCGRGRPVAERTQGKAEGEHGRGPSGVGRSRPGRQRKRLATMAEVPCARKAPAMSQREAHGAQGPMLMEDRAHADGRQSPC
eukprot:3180646-Pleurochrysis_carterae.AAC.1